MRILAASIWLVAWFAFLAACDNGRSSAVVPAMGGQAHVPAVVSPPTDPSVPAASSVLSGSAGALQTEATGLRTNSTLTAAQEANAMPMAGQANDHSAPVEPANPAAAASAR